MSQPEPAVSRRIGAIRSTPKSHLARSATEFGGFLPLMSNTTYTPNQFFDVCLPHCSRSTIRLVGYFLRRTLGWCDQFGRPQEEHIEISFRELAAKSGVSRDRLRTALDHAISGNFIECIREGRPHAAHETGQSALYRLRWQDATEYHKSPVSFAGFFEREGNRTDIPNQFFDHIVPSETLSVIKVVGAVIRSSIGFAARRGTRRQSAALSYTQIQNYTHLRSRKDLALALRTALDRHYIVRLEPGCFDHEKAEQRSAVYALRWADGWSEKRIGQESLPEKSGAEASGIPTSNGPESTPENRSEIPTSIKIKHKNETLNQQQGLLAGPAFELLRKEGFSESAARDLAGRIAVESIHRQIAWLPRRSAARNRLGMLRRAMEDDWPEPQASGKSGRPDFSDDERDGRELVRNFYAGFHGNDGEPLAEPSAIEWGAAAPLVDRLRSAGAQPESFSRWGRELGRMAREQPNAIPSFQIALRQVGDRLCAHAEESFRRSGRVALEVEKVRHRKAVGPQYVRFLREWEMRRKENQPDEYARFEAKRAVARQAHNKDMSPWRMKLLAEFDSEASRLPMLQAFFQLPDFWQWDASENPYPFKSTT